MSWQSVATHRHTGVMVLNDEGSMPHHLDIDVAVLNDEAEEIFLANIRMKWWSGPKVRDTIAPMIWCFPHKDDDSGPKSPWHNCSHDMMFPTQRWWLRLFLSRKVPHRSYTQVHEDPKFSPSQHCVKFLIITHGAGYSSKFRSSRNYEEAG